MAFLKASIKSLLRSLGYRVSRLDSPGGRASMDDAFRALAGRNHGIRTVVDIGASNGSWSAALMQYFPACRYLLIDAQPVHEKALQAFCAHHANAQYVLAAAGERAGELYFDASDPLGGQASLVRRSTADIRVPVVSVDEQVQAKNLAGPFLLKFDTHGFEVPILQGAKNALQNTEAIIMECYNFRIAPEALTFDEMCRHLGQHGFRCIDLVDPMHRPRDGSFWQVDLVFVRSDRPEFGHLKYR